MDLRRLKPGKHGIDVSQASRIQEGVTDEPTWTVTLPANRKRSDFCEPTSMPARVPTPLGGVDWSEYANASIQLINRVHTDAQIQRMGQEIKSLGDRLKQLESNAIGANDNPKSSPFGEVSPLVGNTHFTPRHVHLESREQYTDDLSKLPLAEKSRADILINDLLNQMVSDRVAADKRLSTPVKFLLHGGLESSLCVIESGSRIRIIATVDDDPIFETVNVTLFRIVRPKSLLSALNEVAAALHHEQIFDIVHTKE